MWYDLGMPSLNPSIIYEDSLCVVDMAKRMKLTPCSIRRYIRIGSKSPVTFERVYLEFCYGPRGEKRTSLQAWRRFQEKINGVA